MIAGQDLPALYNRVTSVFTEALAAQFLEKRFLFGEHGKMTGSVNRDESFARSMQ